MEKRIIKCSIDVTKIDKTRLYKGEKGTYLKFALIENSTEYSDWVITEEISKEEREAGKKSTILGNGKNWKPAEKSAPAGSPFKEQEDDLPF